MYKSILLLIIPLVFTFTFDYFVIFNKTLENEEKKLANAYFVKKNITNIFEDSNFNSATINNLYSEKTIENSEKTIENSEILVEKYIVKLKPKLKLAKKSEFFNSKNTIVLNDSLNLISSEWQNSFSNKKINFIKTVLPLIEYENQRILLEREKLLNINEFLSLEKTLKKNDLNYLKKISKKYKISSKNKHKIDIINELLINVNIIPNSIVLAQAANESGWGTSRFATEYNALFGQYTYDENSGVIPHKREKGKKHLIKNFISIDKSVESYFANINSHYAYKNFRKLRSQISDFDNDFNIKILTGTLDVYAEDKSYVDTINKIIDSNKLNQFDLRTKGLFSS